MSPSHRSGARSGRSRTGDSPIDGSHFVRNTKDQEAISSANRMDGLAMDLVDGFGLLSAG